MQKHMLTWGSMLMVALGLWVLMGWHSSAEAVITIKSAAVVNGVAVVEGGNAPRGAPIVWEGLRVTQANNGGNFAFQGVVPADCVGRLEDGVPADAVDVALANCGSVSQGGGMLKTGQTTCYDSAGNVITCTGTGQDGEFQAGTPGPTPRFTDNGDGTVTDHLTQLTWPKSLCCLGQQTWANALAAANALANGHVACSLADGSVAGDWRLPNRNELESLLDLGRSDNPSLPAGHPFVNVLSDYWSSTTWPFVTSNAWQVDLNNGGVNLHPKTSSFCTRAVRGGLWSCFF
jgi:hypothetical protein